MNRIKVVDGFGGIVFPVVNFGMPTRATEAQPMPVVWLTQAALRYAREEAMTDYTRAEMWCDGTIISLTSIFYLKGDQLFVREAKIDSSGDPNTYKPAHAVDTLLIKLHYG
jgi:hypothetical protein